MALIDGHLTKVDAINMVLDAMGQNNVNTASTGLPVAEAAERKIDLENRRLQAKGGGWAFNTRLGVELTRDSGNLFVLPSNTLFVIADNPRHPMDTRPSNSAHLRVSMRRNEDDDKFVLYDNFNNRETWPNQANITVHIVQVIPFKDCPPTFQNYCAVSAAHKTQKGRLKSLKLAQFTQQDVEEAEVDAVNEDLTQRQNNPLLDTVHGYFTTFRHNMLFGS